MFRCMSTRTQIYLTDEQRRRIKEVASAEGVSMAEVIRRALDGYLDEQAEPDKVLAATFGVAKDLEVPSRDEWERG
jgi:predicted DNA-binding protein